MFETGDDTAFWMFSRPALFLLDLPVPKSHTFRSARDRRRIRLQARTGRLARVCGGQQKILGLPLMLLKALKYHSSALDLGHFLRISEGPCKEWTSLNGEVLAFSCFSRSTKRLSASNGPGKLWMFSDSRRDTAFLQVCPNHQDLSSNQHPI